MKRHVLGKVAAVLASAGLLIVGLSACEPTTPTGTTKPSAVSTVPQSGTVTMKIVDKHGKCEITFHPRKMKGKARPRGGFAPWKYTENAGLTHTLCKMAKNPGSKPFKSAGYHLVGKPTSYSVNDKGETSVAYPGLKHVLASYNGLMHLSCYFGWKVYVSSANMNEKTSWSNYDDSYSQFSGKCGDIKKSVGAYEAKMAGKPYDPKKMKPIQTKVMLRYTGGKKIKAQ